MRYKKKTVPNWHYPLSSVPCIDVLASEVATEQGGSWALSRGDTQSVLSALERAVQHSAVQYNTKQYSAKR